MTCMNDTSNESGEHGRYFNECNEIDESFYKSSQKNESGCFTDYFDNLSNADNILSLEHLQMADELNHSSISYWKNRRKVPKFMHEYYLLGDTIGKGSYGKVKDCVDIRTMKRYAMKIVHRMKIKKIPGGMKHVESEINLMKTLCHNNIVKIIEDFQEWDPESRCLVMEFCLGSIHDLQTNGILESSNQFRCLPEWQTRHYFSQIIDGLEYLHSQGLIHKDMKPGNFLLTEHDCVKITDFGVSERLERFQKGSIILGGQTTPAIQPPELAIGAPNICGYKLDIYGTGVSLYFMLCGRVPFSNPNILLIFDEIASGEYTIPDWVSVSASDLIRNMMNKDIKKRFDIAKIRSHAWCTSPGDPIGIRVDPKIHLNYSARDRTKENLYQLSTGKITVPGHNDKYVPAIMPITVVSRLRTYYNWPMTEDEENAEIDDQLIIGEDFIGMDINAYDNECESRPVTLQIEDNNHQECSSDKDIRFFITTQERNDSNNKMPLSYVESELLGRSSDKYIEMPVDYSVSMSQSTFSNREFPDKDSIVHNTIPKTASTSRHFGATKAIISTCDKKSGQKSKFKFGRKIPSRCTQS